MAVFQIITYLSLDIRIFILERNHTDVTKFNHFPHHPGGILFLLPTQFYPVLVLYNKR